MGKDVELLGVVVIGRNEGANIKSCLESLLPLQLRTDYVDSGSTDGSPELARSLCDKVLSLDLSRPFSAARARNEGFGALMSLAPVLDSVQFLDGDCTLIPGWTKAALDAFLQRKELSVIFGHLVERHPERSVYNRLCALEWISPAGDIGNDVQMLGIMIVRTKMFRDMGGFNEQMIAGEDPEFGVRVLLSGGAINKLDVPMATHDANILKFSQWWKRSVRAGYAIGQQYSLHHVSAFKNCSHELKSTFVWGICLPVTMIALPLFDARLLLLPVVAYAVLFIKVSLFRRRFGDSPHDAHLYSLFTVMAKVANGWGLLKYYWRRQSGVFRIIEYK